MKGSRSQQISPANSGSSDSSFGSHGSSSNEVSSNEVGSKTVCLVKEVDKLSRMFLHPLAGCPVASSRQVHKQVSLESPW